MSATALANEAVRSTPGAPQNTPQQPASTLTKYIPTEVITLYVATLATMPSIEKSFGASFKPSIIYWFYVALTPCVFLLIYAGQLRTTKTSFPSFLNWPWWRILASTIAFTVWALAVPENPFLKQFPDGGPIFALAAVFVSVLLGLVEPIVSPSSQRPTTP